jgi:hypothetical protein
MVAFLGVTERLAFRVGALLLAANQRAEPLLVRLEPRQRAKVVMALLGLVIVGAGLVALAWLGGREVRRIARKRPRATSTHEDAWYRKPLVPKEPRAPDEREGE